jgi:predicted transposase/invertase (TIGR01784 family)
MKKSAVKQKPKFNDGLPEILSPRDDKVFRIFFTKNPDAFKAMLASIVKLPDDDLGEIIFIDPHVYPDHADGKIGVLDIKIRVKSKKAIDVEMQKEKIAYLRERVVFYLSGMIREQSASGDDKYEKINRVISVIITNHAVIDEDDAHHHRFTLYDPEARYEFTDLMEVHIIELPKLPKTEDGSDLWNWMKFLTVETKEDLKMIAPKSPIFEKAANTLLEFSEDEIARDRIRRIKMAEADERIRLTEAKREGMEKGMEKGGNEILALLKKGMSVEEAEKTFFEKFT